MITAASIEFKWGGSWNFTTHGHIGRRDERLGLSWETITPKNVMGEYGKPKHFFFIDDDPREFKTIDELIEAYNEKYPEDGETPDTEIQYVRIKINRKTKKRIDETETD